MQPVGSSFTVFFFFFSCPTTLRRILSFFLENKQSWGPPPLCQLRVKVFSLCPTPPPQLLGQDRSKNYPPPDSKGWTSPLPGWMVTSQIEQCLTGKKIKLRKEWSESNDHTLLFLLAKQIASQQRRLAFPIPFSDWGLGVGKRKTKLSFSFSHSALVLTLRSRARRYNFFLKKKDVCVRTGYGCSNASIVSTVNLLLSPLLEDSFSDSFEGGLNRELRGAYLFRKDGGISCP